MSCGSHSVSSLPIYINTSPRDHSLFLLHKHFLVSFTTKATSSAPNNMQYSIVTLVAAASFASAQSSTSSAAASAAPTGTVIPLGQSCTPDGTPCALGAQCYATNSMLQTVCGNFQAACTSNEQCAFNTCNTQQSLCNGFLASSASSIIPSTTSTPGGFIPAPSPTTTAPAGSLPLGAECNPFVNPSQCADGAQCWASNAGIIARCGNFNAACTSNSQCAGTTCNNGLCNGLLVSSSGAGNATSSATPSTLQSSTSTDSATGSVTRSASGSATRIGSATATTSVAQFTGAAVVNAGSGGMAVVLGAAGWAW